jgi:hypothetical protein
MPSLGFGSDLALRHRRAGVPVFDFTGGFMPAGAVLARGSAATQIDASGRIVSMGSDVARFDYDPATLALRGLLIEPARSNLLGRSEQLQLVTVSNVTVMPDIATAPDGATTMDRLTPAAATASVFVSLLYTKAMTTTYCLSAFFKGGGGARYALMSAHSFSNGRLAWFDLDNGVVAQLGPNVTSASMRDHGNGVWRCAMVFTGSNSQHNILTANKAAGSSDGSSFTGTESVLAWGAMLEEGSAATSYLATPGTSAVARAADTLTLDWGSTGIGDGTITARVTFDDLTTQDVALSVSGGHASLTSALLNRMRVRRIETI